MYPSIPYTEFNRLKDQNVPPFIRPRTNQHSQ